MLSCKQFNALSVLMRDGFSTQRELAKKIGCSLGATNSILAYLRRRGFVSEKISVTARGRQALQPYKVNNAIIMAAGMSSRFAPLSYEKPKGVLVVKGEVLIERQIRQLQDAGIRDITVVVGYMKEKFFYLQDKFGVDIVVNEDYYRYNNPSTLIRVMDKLKNTYICSSDNYFTENVFEPFVYDSYYAATYFPGKVNEWGIKVDKHGLIKGIDHSPVDMWCMMGHVYFSREFSKKFKRLLTDQYEQCRTQLWEHLFEANVKSLPMYVRKYSSDTIKEFDSLDELRAFDDKYLRNADSKIFKNICRTLHCQESEIVGIEVVKQGLTNLSFKFMCKGKAYVYRHPGAGTEAYISRKSEAFSLSVAKKLGLDLSVVVMDAKKGWKISKYIENARCLDYHNPNDVRKAIDLMRRLHDAKVHSPFKFDIWEKVEDFVKKTTADHKDFEDYTLLYKRMKSLYALVQKEKPQTILCHCDCYSPNFLVDRNGRMTLIDWEYSGASDPGIDVGTFVCCSDFSALEIDDFLVKYHGHKVLSHELRHDYAYIALAAYYWFVWAVFQESLGNAVGEYLLLWYRMAKDYLAKAFEFYK